MPQNLLLWARATQAVLKKDVLGEYRSRYIFASLGMFTLITLASISMSLGGADLPPPLLAALFWVVLFFSAMSGLSRVFVQEQDAGTLVALCIYAGAQAVLFGKWLFNLILLTGLLFIIVPLFLLFFNVQVWHWGDFTAVTLLGVAGLASVSTLTAALVTPAKGKGTLFTVLTFPLLLPQFLAAIQATERVFSQAPVDTAYYGFMLGYDVSVIAAATILFDYLWRE